jgi:hypothetical protein
MKKIVKKIFGKHFLTSAAGYVASGLMAFQEYHKPDTDVTTVVVAIAIAVLGRLSADANKVELEQESK